MSTAGAPAKRTATEAQLDASAAAVATTTTPAAQETVAGAPNKVELVALPQKKFFRQRAHCNPLSFSDSFDYPLDPDHFDHASHYPIMAVKEPGHFVDFVDIGCGFGGLLMSLSTAFPDKLMIGMEIRTKVCEYVHQKILSLRSTGAAADPASTAYQNISVCRANTMRYATNFFRKGQLEKVFICFPDPHFKNKNHRRRIVSPALLDEYAYFLQPGGLLYTVTDVKDLGEWHDRHCSAHLLFEKVPEDELAADPAVPIVLDHTEEGKKVSALGRFGKKKYLHVFRRLAAPRAAFELR